MKFDILQLAKIGLTDTTRAGFKNFEITSLS
jgi:hypothetical protein